MKFMEDFWKKFQKYFFYSICGIFYKDNATEISEKFMDDFTTEYWGISEGIPEIFLKSSMQELLWKCMEFLVEFLEKICRNFIANSYRILLLEQFLKEPPEEFLEGILLNFEIKSLVKINLELLTSC